MTLFSYKVFVTIVEHMNFRAAADQLNLTPSAVSHCVSTMEEELGFPLFVRQKNKISLTSDAKLLLPAIRQVLRSEEAVSLLVEEINGLQRGTVRLGCFSTVCISWMPQILERFKEEFPGIEVELFQGNYTDICRWIENGNIDIGFLSVSSAGTIPVEPLYEDPLVAVVPHGFSAKHKNYIEIAELQNQQYVQPAENGDADSQKLLADHESFAATKCHVVDDLSMLKMVEAGCGVCILPKLLTDAYQVQVHVDTYPLKPAANRVIGLAFYEPSKGVPAVQRLAQVIRDMIAEQSAKTEA